MKKHLKTYIYFASAGTLGFLVDAGILYLLVHLALWNPYGARIISFTCAAFCTWQVNRRFTFTSNGKKKTQREGMEYFLLSACTASLNYGIYCLCIYLLPFFYAYPVLAIAVASAFTMVVNFLSYRFIVFK